MSTITRDYAATHSALSVVARSVGLAPADVRVLIALAERGPARSDELERDLGIDSSALRRSLLALYKRGLCAGAPRKRGTRTTVSLTDAGNAIAEMALTHRRTLLKPGVQRTKRRTELTLVHPDERREHVPVEATLLE
jgi:DNA-binding MarR family transcriptional regulator